MSSHEMPDGENNSGFYERHRNSLKQLRHHLREVLTSLLLVGIERNDTAAAAAGNGGGL